MVKFFWVVHTYNDFLRTHSIEKAKYSTCKLEKYDVFTERVRINQEASPFLEILPVFHSSLVKISHILKAMIFQFRVDMFLRPNNEKITSDFIMCVCVYSKYIHLHNSSKTNDFLFQISRLFVLLNVVPLISNVSYIWYSILNTKYNNAKRSIPTHATFVNNAHRDLHLWPPKSIKVILLPWLTCLPSLIKKHTTVLSLTCSQAYLIDVHCVLDLWTVTSKINRVYSLTVVNLSAKFDEKAHVGSVYIVSTSLFPYMSIVTLTFDLQNQ